MFLSFHRGEIQAILDWESSISGCKGRDLFKAEWLFMDSFRTEKVVDDLRSYLYRGYKSESSLKDEWKERKKLYALLDVRGAMASFPSWKVKLSEEEETVSHKSSRDLTIGWFLLRVIPVLNLYFFWKMSGIISGHETRPSEKQSIEEERNKKKILAFVLPFVFLFLFFNLSTSTIQYRSYRQQIANGLGRSLLDEPADLLFISAEVKEVMVGEQSLLGAFGTILANTARAFKDPVEAFVTEFAIPIDPLPIQLTPEVRV